MSRRRSCAIRALTVLCVAVCLAAATVPAHAGDTDREARWQFSVPVTWFSSETIDGQNGSSLDVSGDMSWGFSFGYNINGRWMVGADFTFLDASYDATVVTDTDGNGTPDGTTRVNGRLDASSFQVTGQFNFLERSVTPFVRGSVGSTYVDSNVVSGPPSGICWWVPPWGYICDTYVPTYDANSFSYGAAAGVRGEVGDRFYLEGSAGLTWIDVDNADTANFTGYRLNMGWLF